MVVDQASYLHRFPLCGEKLIGLLSTSVEWKNIFKNISSWRPIEFRVAVIIPSLVESGNNLPSILSDVIS